MTITKRRSEVTEDTMARYSTAMMVSGSIIDAAAAFKDDFLEMLCNIERMHAVGYMFDPAKFGGDFLGDDNRELNAKILGCIGRFIADLRKQKVIE